jgi:hypothetical protein
MDLKGMQWEDVKWTHLAEDMDQWKAVVNLQVP